MNFRYGSFSPPPLLHFSISFSFSLRVRSFSFVFTCILMRFASKSMQCMKWKTRFCTKTYQFFFPWTKIFYEHILRKILLNNFEPITIKTILVSTLLVSPCHGEITRISSIISISLYFLPLFYMQPFYWFICIIWINWFNHKLFLKIFLY